MFSYNSTIDAGHKIPRNTLQYINSLRLAQMATILHMAFSNVLSNENLRISINISINFIPKDPVNNIPALVQIMAWPATRQSIICINDG